MAIFLVLSGMALLIFALILLALFGSSIPSIVLIIAVLNATQIFRLARSSARNVAAMSMIITAIFLLAPPGVGFIAEHFGLTAAFLVMLPFVAMSGLFAREADPPTGDYDPQKMIGNSPVVDGTNAPT